MMYCLRVDQHIRAPGEYFVYFPPGYEAAAISQTYDVSSVVSVKREAISKHLSQAHDMKMILQTVRSEECFLIKTK